MCFILQLLANLKKCKLCIDHSIIVNVNKSDKKFEIPTFLTESLNPESNTGEVYS